MATKTLHLQHSFNGELATVYESIFDFRKFGELHPYMVEVNELSKTASNGIEYEVKEDTVLLGFLRMKPEYKAEVIEIEPLKHVRYVSNVKGGIVLVIDFRFTQAENPHRAVVSETIEVKGNRFLIAYFMTIVKKAHLQLFANLANRLKKQRVASKR
jgi:hypothetical protein